MRHNPAPTCHRRWVAVLGVLLIVAGGLAVTPAQAAAPDSPVVGIAGTSTGAGYVIVTEGGQVFSYGDAPDLGGLTGAPAAPIVGVALTPDNGGYWLWGADGGATGFGNAGDFGSMAGIPLNQPIVGGGPTPTGAGYWLWAADGGLFAFGDARFHGSMGGIPLNQPVVGGASTPSGKGYWLWASDGGLFAFGDARFYGSMGSIPLNLPILEGGATPSGKGYTMLAADGGSFAFGDARFTGSSAGSGITFSAAAPAPDGGGFWLMTADGYLQVHGTAPRLGAPQPGPPPQPATPIADAQVRLTPFATLDQPVSLITKSGDSAGVYVAERPGRVIRLDRANPAVRHTVLDMSSLTSAGGERGLLGIEFSADASKLYVNYTDLSGDLRIAEFTMSGTDPAATTGGTPRLLIAVDQPYSNHNGGDLHLGPDGYLYIGSGDGGSGGDPENNAQNRSNLLGAILRIDPTPSGGSPYTVPADNPFVGSPGVRPELWHYGLRNPWRFSFDSDTGEMWIGDVGQSRREEIDRAPAGVGGLNFGWRIREGSLAFNGTDPGGLTPPVFEYGHDEGCSITGGLVYRDGSVPALEGAYLFADFCAGEIRALRYTTGRVVDEGSLGVSLAQVAAFGRDTAGEVYVLSLGGEIVRLDP